MLLVGGVPGRGARIVEDVRRLEPDEATVRTGEREGFGPSVDRLAANDMLERDTLVPTVPLLLATEGTSHARTAAAEKIKYVLRRHGPLGGHATALGLAPPDGGVSNRLAPQDELRSPSKLLASRASHVGGLRTLGRFQDAGPVRAP
jgi:hypothetical protein